MIITTEVLDKPRITIDPIGTNPSAKVSVTRILGSGKPIYDIKPIMVSTEQHKNLKKPKRKNSVVTEIHTIPFIFNEFNNNSQRYNQNACKDKKDNQVSKACIVLKPSKGDEKENKSSPVSSYAITTSINNPKFDKGITINLQKADGESSEKFGSGKKPPFKSTLRNEKLNEPKKNGRSPARKTLLSVEEKSKTKISKPPVRLDKDYTRNGRSPTRKTFLTVDGKPRTSVSPSRNDKLTTGTPRGNQNPKPINKANKLDIKINNGKARIKSSSNNEGSPVIKPKIKKENVGAKNKPDDSGGGFLNFGRYSFRKKSTDKNKEDGSTFKRAAVERRSLPSTKKDIRTEKQSGLKIEKLKEDLKNSSLSVINTPPKSRASSVSNYSPKNSRKGSFFARSAKDSRKGSFFNFSGMSSRKNSDVHGKSKRPSISALQNNSAFIEELKERKNSLTAGEVRTRSNSLNSLVNFKSKSRNVSVSKKARKNSSKRMAKTTTTTETRTYQKDDLWFEETVETTVIESKDGTRTSTKTTTKQLPAPPVSEVTSPIQDSSSSDSEEKNAPPEQKEDGGFFSRLRGRKTSKGDTSSSSDEETLKTLSQFDKNFAKEMLDTINGHRAKHGVRGLKLSDKLTSEATRWATHCATKDKMQHKQSKETGENIYRLTANMAVEKDVASADKIVNHWYSEVEKHKFGEEPSGTKLNSGHFSQMVWKDTTQLGVGIAISASKRSIYIVAFFNPKGNWMGEFATHVPPIGGFPASSKGSKASDKLSKMRLKSSSSSDEDEEGDFNASVLKAHNDYRKKHGVGPLKLSDKLNKFAEEWAKTIAKKDRMEHRSNNDYGENLYAKWASNPNHSIPGKEAVESWYSEIKDHVFGKEPKSLATGHFTQVVWEDSKSLGVGMARNKKSGKLYVVCNYEPAGNFVGKFAKKVPPPK